MADPIKQHATDNCYVKMPYEEQLEVLKQHEKLQKYRLYGRCTLLLYTEKISAPE